MLKQVLDPSLQCPCVLCMCVISASRRDLCVPWTTAVSRSALAADLSAPWMLRWYLSDTGVLPAPFSCFASVYLHLLYWGCTANNSCYQLSNEVFHFKISSSLKLFCTWVSPFWFIMVNVYAVWLKITTGNRGEGKRVHKKLLLSKSVLSNESLYEL